MPIPTTQLSNKTQNRPEDDPQTAQPRRPIRLRIKLAVCFGTLTILVVVILTTILYRTVHSDLRGAIGQERRFFSSALAILAGMLPFVLAIGWWLGERLAAPIKDMVNGAERVTEGDIPVRIRVVTRDETGLLAQAFNRMVERITDLIASLRQQVDDRTREIDRRANYSATVEEVGRLAYTILDTDQLLKQVIELIRKQFDLYYVGLFLVSEDGKWAVLHAGTGKAGQSLMDRQHRLPIGEGMIGWCIANARPRVANEVNQDSIHIENPDLPGTRSEAALPLRTHERVLGALTVQSEGMNTFDDIAMAALRTITDQIAIILENDRLSAESQETQSVVQRSSDPSNQADWEKILYSRSNSGYYVTKDNLFPLEDGSPGFDIAQINDRSVLHLPIRIRGQVLGAIHARKLDTAGAWKPEETSLLETLTDQLSIALDNARLYRDAQRSAEREHIISDITAKVRASTNVNVILQTAVKELAEALRTTKATIQLHDGSRHQAPDNSDHIDPPLNGGDSHA
jgi:GAF domain-containing protein/HAMP domain-containing protein